MLDTIKELYIIATEYENEWDKKNKAKGFLVKYFSIIDFYNSLKDSPFDANVLKKIKDMLKCFLNLFNRGPNCKFHIWIFFLDKLVSKLHSG